MHHAQTVIMRQDIVVIPVIDSSERASEGGREEREREIEKTPVNYYMFYFRN